MINKFFFTILLSILIYPFLNGSEAFAQEQEPLLSQDSVHVEYLRGKVIAVLEEEVLEGTSQISFTQKLKVEITSGSLEGREVEIESSADVISTPLAYDKGDRVLIAFSKNFDNKDVFYIYDFDRSAGLIALVVLFMVISVAVVGKRVLLSFSSLVISFAMLIIFILPAIQQGRDPVIVSILGSLLIIPVTFYLSHGYNKKTTISVVSTLISLIITGLLSVLFVNWLNLSGASSEESLFLQLDGKAVYDLKGILLAGIIIGTLGVLDDVTVSQASIVNQLFGANKKLGFKDLYTKSLVVGKDHISSIINTLVLVYTGASMPLLLLFLNNQDQPFINLVNYQPIAEEIVRTLVGSVGLVLSIPVTTFIAAYYVVRSKKPLSEDDHH